MDPERERMRLAELYSSMADVELLELAEDPASLTDPAQQALKDEISRRGLSIQSEHTPQTNDMELVDFVTVLTFKVLGEAVIAKGVLASAGIRSVLLDEYDQLMDDEMLDLTWFPSVVRDTIRLQVSRGDAEAATELLKQPVPGYCELPGQETE